MSNKLSMGHISWLRPMSCVRPGLLERMSMVTLDGLVVPESLQSCFWWSLGSVLFCRSEETSSFSKAVFSKIFSFRVNHISHTQDNCVCIELLFLPITKVQEFELALCGIFFFFFFFQRFRWECGCLGKWVVGCSICSFGRHSSTLDPNGGIFAFTSVRNFFTEMHNDMHLHSGSPYRLCIKYSTSHVSIAQGKPSRQEH